MKPNIGSTDKLLRLALAVVFILLAAFKVLSGAWAILAIVFAVVFAITAFVGFCPLYLPFNFSTKNKNN